MAEEKRINTIAGYEILPDNYTVDSDGHLWNRLTNREIGNRPDNKGYLTVTLPNCKRVRIHKIVALAFVDGYEPGLTVDHINGDKTDNRVENLQWLSNADNVKKATELRVGKYTWDGELVEEFGSITDACEKTGLSRPTIIAHCKGRRDNGSKKRAYTWNYIHTAV